MSYLSVHTCAALLSAAAAIDTKLPACKLPKARMADPVCSMDCSKLLLPRPLCGCSFKLLGRLWCVLVEWDLLRWGAKLRI